MGFRDQWYEWHDAFRRAITLAIAVAGIVGVAWMVAVGWHSAGVLGALAVLIYLAFEFGVRAASRQVIRVFAMVFLAFSMVLLAFTDFTPAGALGVSGALTFFACDFALQRHEDRKIRLDSD